MKRFEYLKAGFLLIIFSFIQVGNAVAQSEQPDKRMITVSGEGAVHVVPDKATVRFGIVTNHADPEEARSQNAQTAKEAMNVVRTLGVDERKLRLAALRLQPVREYNPQTRRPEDKGYEAVRELVVELEDLDQLPTLIARIVQNGANRLSGVSYGLQDRDAVRDEALVLAVTRAREKANLMAASLGVELGSVLRINEQSFSMPSPVVRMADQTMMMSKAEAAPEPEAYAAGEMEIKAIVQVTFELK